MMTTRDELGRRRITVDTGGPDDIFRGALVTWLHVPSGGYGFTLPVEAKVLHVTRARVTIELQTNAGSTLKRSVDPVRLRWRN